MGTQSWLFGPVVLLLSSYCPVILLLSCCPPVVLWSLREGRDWKKLQNEEKRLIWHKTQLSQSFHCVERHKVKFLQTSRNNKSLTRTNSLNRKFHWKTVISSFLCHLISDHMKLLRVFYSLTMRIKCAWIFHWLNMGYTNTISLIDDS